MTGLGQNLKQRLSEIEGQHLYRRRKVLDGPQGVVVSMQGKRLLNFCSNDYLGLANHPEVVRALQKGAAEFGAGSGAAHLVCGHSKAHHALEEELADFLGCDRVLLFSTGYMANLGVISALLGRGDCVFEDRLNHASLLDGGLLSGARFRRFPHVDMQALDSMLRTANGKNKLIVSDGVFSMDGELAPLPKMAEVADKSGAWLMVDDAHGIGVIGDRGRGAFDHYKMNVGQADVLVGTLGKGFGTFGAFVAGSEELVEFLIQKARSYIYTTAIPSSVVGATRVSLQLVIKEPWRRQKLVGLISHFRAGAERLGLKMVRSFTPIQPILIGDSRAALEMSEELQKQGVLVSAIRPPTVPEGSARLRVTFSAAHEIEHVDCLLDALDYTLVSQSDG